MASAVARQPYSAPSSATMPHAQYRGAGTAQAVQHSHNLFTSPTESEFSESYKDAPNDTAANEWDEVRVSDWLKSINCAQYIDLFRRNNITGENLMDMDQSMLKEIGIKKIGDRVRLGTQVKLLRTSIYKKNSKKAHNRDSLALLDVNAQFIPLAAGSPRALYSARPLKFDKSASRQLSSELNSTSRPTSPMIDQENRRVRNGMPSPLDGRKDHSQAPGSARYGAATPRLQGDTPQTARFASSVRQMPSLDNINTTNVFGALPNDKPFIRVIYDNGTSSVVNITGFRNAEDIVRTSLKNGALNENHVRSYCFYVLDGTDPDPAFCRRISEAELVKLCNDRMRSERGRLLLRKIHAGVPEGDQLKTAAQIAEQQLPSPPAIEVQMPPKRSQLKIEAVTGEALPAHSYPMSPASQEQRNQYFESHSNLSRNVSVSTTASARARKLKEIYAQRPPTELITQDLESYFPEVAKEEMDRTVRMSVRRSVRMSKALSRLSIASNFSINSLIDKDAPPIPSVADSWLAGSLGKPAPRPLSVVRLAQSRQNYRDSVASSMLEPLDEESPLESNRKSYISFSGDDASASNVSITDPEGNTVMQTYYDDNNSSPANTEGGGSLNSRLSQFIAEDGEEPDDELMQHLEHDSWDNLKYMKGAMIGQGSFGTVWLALHAVTAELMAVKQVEVPTNQGTAMDKKKNMMIEALKHEISLLKELKHPNIVQYLGSSTDDEHLNIFLEYVAGGSVATMLVTYGSLPQQLICNFVRQILEGLNYLHSQDIIHRDIKGANILVDNKGTVKISDFGISKRVEASTLLHTPKGRGGPRVSLQGSVFWMAPEVVRQTAYTKKADIWSLGCLIVEMFTGSHPHPNCTQLQALFKIGHSGANAEAAKPDLPENASKEARDFLSRTFEIEHDNRPTAAELLASEFCMLKA